MNSHKVLISIINWNNFLLTDKCIESIFKNNYNDFKIVLIDNDSIDNSFEKLYSKYSNYSKLKLLKLSANLGFAGGHLEAIKSENINDYCAIWLLNNDITINEDALSKLIDYHIKHPNNVLGSLILNQDKKISFAGIPLNHSEQYKNIYSRFSDKLYSEVKDQLKTEDIKGVNGASYFIPISIYRKIGFIPTHYFMYYEEEDYNYTLKINNIKTTLIHNSLIFHNVGYSSKLGKKIPSILKYYKTRNSKILSKKIFGYSTRNYILNCWGFIPFLISMFYKLLSKIYPNNIQLLDKYMTNLGLYHFYIGKTGKTFDPNNYLD